MYISYKKPSHKKIAGTDIFSQNSHQEPSFMVHISSGQGLEQEPPYPIEILIVKVSIDNDNVLCKSFSDNLHKVKQAAKLCFWLKIHHFPLP
jgi:hypothetical protein